MSHTSIAKTVSRISLDHDLRRNFKRLRPGTVLDVGSKNAPYKQYIPHTAYTCLDVDSSDNPDVCADVHDMQYQDNHFDTVIATELLEHLKDPQKAVNEIYRVLKPGGICIASTRFIYPYHPDPSDYYRFTWDSLRNIFHEFSTVEIYHHGNRVQVLWEIMSDCGKIVRVILSPITPIIARIHFKKTNYPCGFMVYAQK